MALVNSFSAAAELLLSEQEAETFLPTLFLLTHALELNLKAFLFAQGASDRKLRSIGHDLVTCIRVCRKHDLARHVILTRAAVVQVIRINKYYSDKELEYFAPRAKRFGSLEVLANTVATVSAAVFGPITEKTFRAR